MKSLLAPSIRSLLSPPGETPDRRTRLFQPQKVRAAATVLGAIAAVVGGLMASDGVAQADPVYWVNWTASNAAGATGTVQIGGTSVDVTYTGQSAFVQTNGGSNYWSPRAPYVSATVDNEPPASDIIAMSARGARKIVFSKPVRNPLFAFGALNGNGYAFDTDFTILSQGAGFFGNGVLAKDNPAAGVFRLNGVSGEPHGVIEFQGVVSEVNWTALSDENWNGFQLALRGVSCKGHLGTPGGAVGEVCSAASPVCAANGSCGGAIANGAAIPANPAPNNAAPFDGTCNASSAPLCAAGLCSAADQRCGARAGEPAARANQCRSGILAGDGTCAAVCGNGTLEPGEGCDDSNKTDGDGCAATCTLENGRTCSVNAAGLVGNASCQSAVCAADGSCGQVNGQQAATASACRSGVRAADGRCGVSNGVAPGVGGAADCASLILGADGKCGLPNGTQPGAGGALECASSVLGADGACGKANGETAGSPLECRVAILGADGKCGHVNGTQPGLGGANECASLVVGGDGKCGKANGEAAASALNAGAASSRRTASAASRTASPPAPAERPTANSASQCRDGALGADGKCTNACTVAMDCALGSYCDVTASPKVCTVKTPVGAACKATVECTVGSCTAGICGVPNGETPGAGGVAECASKALGADGKCGKANGEAAASASQCRIGILGTDGKCGVTNGAAPAGGGAPPCASLVVGADGKCGKSNGEAATTVAQCRGGVLAPNGLCGVANGTAPGAGGAGDCASLALGSDGKCGKTNGEAATSASQCRDGALAGDGTCTNACAATDECATGFYCAKNAPKVCVGKKPAGATCTATDECSVGGCNSGVCGVPNGEAPGAGGAFECATRVSGADGKCGKGDGEAAASAAQCRSALLGADGLCAPRVAPDAGDSFGGGACDVTPARVSGPAGGLFAALAVVAASLVARRKRD
ncbi:hypothetical protein OUZ56_032326 [Daphnia magna]|uniref:DUF4215 domain-containing protein n=1 Tax=Daphnia magna TaxID=35525 RepID=A0ABR0B8K8_9CRUS|nr:hypothetical protein OUZ56_032326 [Daphnia magna]